MRNYRFKFTIALGIGAICGMLWTPVKLVHAEQQASNIIAEAEADQEPAAGYVKIEENSSGPELYSDYDIAMYSTDSTTPRLRYQEVAICRMLIHQIKHHGLHSMLRKL